MGGLEHGLMLVGELDKDVFETGSEGPNLGDGDAVFQELLAEIVEIEMVVDERVDGLSENSSAADARKLAGEAESTRDFRSGDFHAYRARGLDVRQFAQRIGRAVGDNLAKIDVSDVIAAFGFVHVVRGDEKRDAMSGELEKKIPELAPRDRIDAGSGLVEKEECGLVQHGAAESQALLPASRKLRRQTIEVGREAVELDDFVDAALQPSAFEAVDAAGELHVFADR